MAGEPLSEVSGNGGSPAGPPLRKPPRNVHVLFVHGVGQHSRLSSLLRPYQAVRSNLRSSETPVNFEDLIPGWHLERFEDDATPPHLKLAPKFKGLIEGQPEAVYFYEVNYSNLAGVVRENHSLDMTRLFVGFDLAVNAARARLGNAQAGNWPLEHVAIAGCVQRMARVFAAATVPILGLPAVLLRNYTSTFVGTFTRFFEDIATFAMDKNGEQLISAHVDRTVASIVGSEERFSPGDETHSEDVFVIAAHSLGTVVAHNFLVRNWEKGGRCIPSTLLTFGSPIGLICWLWLFLDYREMMFDPKKDTGENYFCWTPKEPTSATLQPLHWINVVNHLDPIATAFPSHCVDLLRPLADVEGALRKGGVDTHFIRTGGPLSAGLAHTAYFDDRRGFLGILTLVARLRPEEASDSARNRSAAVHWPAMLQDLEEIQVKAAALGVAALIAYFVFIARAYDEVGAIPLILLYVFPPITVGFLAFFQRLLFGWPTKRTQPKDCRSLPFSDSDALPYRFRVPPRRLWFLLRLRLRQCLRQRQNWQKLILRRVPWSGKKVDPNAPRLGVVARFTLEVISFLPTLATMLAPVWFAFVVSGSRDNPYTLIVDHLGSALGLFALFFVYLICFSVSEFASSWRSTIKTVLKL